MLQRKYLRLRVQQSSENKEILAFDPYHEQDITSLWGTEDNHSNNKPQSQPNS